MRVNKASNITTGGILIALTLVILYLTSMIHISNVTLLTVTSLFVPVALMRCNLKTALAVYIGASLLSFMLIPLNISLMYILFFGIYGIIKYLAEKKFKLKALEYIVKLLFFNIMLIIYYFLFTSFIGKFEFPFSIGFSIILIEIIFLIYDYALTLLIIYYLQKLHHRIK
ncbi:hypothetical protein [uncultured Clostridium sp.]|uniref:hypothetical protein n=1 Tax=uncultured Clostridium sp. TaxID=59620 RepID=UPI00261847B0|nr:hypothetical protein [uncultured Clostridium sp.]